MGRKREVGLGRGGDDDAVGLQPVDQAGRVGVPRASAEPGGGGLCAGRVDIGDADDLDIVTAREEPQVLAAEEAGAGDQDAGSVGHS